MHGNIDISYAVKGTKGEGIIRFKSTRKSRMGLVGYIEPKAGGVMNTDERTV